MPYSPRARSVSDELALLQDLAASRRVASFKALVARHQRSLRSTSVTAPRVSPPELPNALAAPAAAPDAPALHRAYKRTNAY
jgi:hypothetical protein